MVLRLLKHMIVPSIIHSVLRKPVIKERVLIVGDIHGCVDEFKDILQKCSYDANHDTLIIAGDMINKGPYSAEVVQYARELKSYAVMGNHDHHMLKYALNKEEELPPYLDYVDKLSDDDIDWLKDLPYSISLPDFDTLIVHAGIVPDKTLWEQDLHQMITMRNIIHHEDGTMEGVSDVERGVPWVNLYQGQTKIVFGHDARRGLQKFDNVIGLDTGCCYGRQLSAVILPSMEVVQVDARKVYSQPKPSD